MMRHPKRLAERAHLVFKQLAQRLYDLLKIHRVGQTAHVVVALNHRRMPLARFNHVGVYRALCEEIHLTDFIGFFLKHTDKFFADDFALFFGFRHARQLG